MSMTTPVREGYKPRPRLCGGPTQYGVTQAELSVARGRPVSQEELEALTLGEALEIIRKIEDAK